MSSLTSSGQRSRSRRNPRWLALGLLATCIGGLGGAALFVKVTDAQPVLVTAKAVARGSQLNATDLGIVHLAEVPGLRTVAGDQLQLVVGQEALVDMAAGTVVTPDSFGDLAFHAGTVRVGLKLAQGRLPARPLPVGSPVVLISVPIESLPPDVAAVAQRTFAAEIATAPVPAEDGSGLVLDVSVPSERAAELVGLAALDQVSLVAE